MDPAQGRRRRAALRDRAVGALNNASSGLGRTARYAGGHLRGAAANASGLFTGPESISDEKLVARVRSETGRATSHPDAVHVRASSGVVTLSGTVPADEHKALLAAVGRVRGVWDVEDFLHPYDRAHEPAATEGGPAYGGGGQWSPAARVLAGAGGAALAVSGIHRGGLLGGLVACAGLCLTTRGLTNLSATRLTGLGAGARAVDVHKTVEIGAPRDLVFGFFSSYEGFPMFMSNVRKVTDYGDGRSHWTVAGPGGITVQWEAVITDYVPHELIAWRSVEGSTVANAGVIRFSDAGPDGAGTRVDISLSYNPPGGALGHLVAKLFGSDPKSEMDADLERVKTTLETGRPPQDAADPVVLDAVTTQSTIAV